MKYRINTPCGEIEGTQCQWPGVIAYKGIRYATAGRFEYPKLVTQWDGLYDATKYGNCSYQPRAFYDEEQMIEKVFYYNEFRRGETYTYSEDCLFLNIWTPESATNHSKLPVIVYIHGGGFTGGCGHEKHFDGPIWPTQDVIAVTLNYRLGPLGFICLPELKEEAGHTGNYGLYDQMTALQWVQKNIRAFGGDPDNVTLMGQSAGAMSVQQLCVSPLTNGLFHKAVMSSGGGVSKLLGSKATSEDRYAFWQDVMNRAGCKSLQELRNIEPEKLFTAWKEAKAADKKAGMVASPCIDGVFLTKSALEAANAGEQKDIAYMLGSTSHDIVPPIVFKMAKDWCELQQKQGKKESYCWFMNRNLPGDENGAWHSADLWYWFGTLSNCWRPFTELDRSLSEQMVNYLCNFARTGNPNGQGLKEWLSTTGGKKSVLCWGDDHVGMRKVNNFKLIYTMLTNKAVGE